MILRSPGFQICIHLQNRWFRLGTMNCLKIGKINDAHSTFVFFFLNSNTYGTNLSGLFKISQHITKQETIFLLFLYKAPKIQLHIFVNIPEK